MLYTANRGFLIFFLLLLLSPPPSAAKSATPNGENYPHQSVSPSLAGILIVMLLSTLLIGTFVVCIRNCFDNNNITTVNDVAGNWICETRGLEASVMETFPTMVYSEIKVHKIGRGALECAVCLNEYEDHETLRLIPNCDHVFHTDCIDAWLASHTTCPVCRANLATQKGERVVSRRLAESNNTEIDIEAQIVRNDSEPEERRTNSNNADSDVEAQVALEAGVIGLNRNLNRSDAHGSIPIHTAKPLFPRSHSTGHSIVQPGKNIDRFTLRLPANVRNQLMNRKLNRTTSLILPKERSLLRGYRFTEDDRSSRGKFFAQFIKMDRGVKSDR